jgi:hypothetical protein
MSWLQKTGQIYGWFAELYIIAIPVAIALSLLAVWWTHGQRGVRSNAISLSIAIPFGCVAYGTLVIMFWTCLFDAPITPERIARDSQIYPMMNGYTLGMGDDGKNCYIVKRNSGPASHAPYRDRVTAMQVEGDLVIGRSDLTTRAGQHYFLLDTKAEQLTEFSDSMALREVAEKRRIVLHLTSPERYVQDKMHFQEKVYDKRLAWLYPLLLIPMTVWVGGWVRRLWRMSRPIRISVEIG